MQVGDERALRPDADVARNLDRLAVDEEVEVLVDVDDLALLGERVEADRAQAQLQLRLVARPRRRRLQRAGQRRHVAEDGTELRAAGAAVVAVVAVPESPPRAGVVGVAGVAAAGQQQERDDAEKRDRRAGVAGHRVHDSTSQAGTAPCASGVTH